MRYLGIDYGERRIGLALSDEAGRMAFPCGVVRHLGEVAAVIKKEQVKALVVGLPTLLSGASGVQAKTVKAFVIRLKKAVQLPVYFENEMFTTGLAERHSAKAKADAAAAALILQSYLDKRRLETSS